MGQEDGAPSPNRIDGPEWPWMSGAGVDPSVFETVVHRSIRPIVTALACVYLPFAIVPIIRSGRTGVVLAATTLSMAVAMVALRFMADRLPKRWAHTTMGLVFGLLVLRALLGWSLYGGDSETGFVSSTLVVSSVVCLSRNWFVALNIFGMVGWALILWLGHHAWPQSYMFLLLFAGPCLGIAFRRARIEGIQREESFRIRDERARESLSAAFQAIERSEDRFRGIVERINDVFCRVDLEGNIELISPSVKRYGYRPEDLLGKPVHDLHTDASKVDDAIRLVIERGEIVDYELPVRTKSGERREAAVSAHVLYENGVPAAFEGTLRDITERKQMAEDLRLHKEELEHAQRLRIMGEMVAQMAHELNQPLASIHAYAAACIRRIRSGQVTNEKLTEGFEKICEQALRAGDIIQRTRTFASKKPPRYEPVDVIALLEDVFRLLEPELLQRGVTIDFDPPRDLPPVPADRVQIQQVLANLILNGAEALDPTSDDHALTIGVSRFKDDAIEITVRDCGRGIGTDPEEMFEAFVTTKTNGLGMGLAISRSIVHAHGGSLWATPNAERGTTFHFTLPLEQRSSGPAGYTLQNPEVRE